MMVVDLHLPNIPVFLSQLLRNKLNLNA